MNFNDKLTELIFTEIKTINKIIEEENLTQKLTFSSASVNEFIYAMKGYQIIFEYYPDRYEFGKSMVLKGTSIRLNFDVKRNYDSIELLRFITNRELPDSSDNLSHKEQFTLTLECLHEIEKDKNSDWENEFNVYLKAKNPW